MNKSSGTIIIHQDPHYSAKDQYMQELERQLACANEKLKMEKEKLLCIQEVGITLIV